MSASAFLVQAQLHDISVSTEGGKLRLVPSSGSAIPRKMVEQAQLHKDEIIEQLNNPRGKLAPPALSCLVAPIAEAISNGGVNLDSSPSPPCSKDLWCVECGRFAEETKEGTVLLLYKSYYCSDCYKL